jgi:D-beta-D-heptose 7-phosphate kinase/D-beta-D-heptose 1-phosphate adenosyltransferase
MKLAIVSGGFDPVHVGHLECFEKAKSMADHLFVIVNDDKFLERKKGKAFMNWRERLTITQAFKPVTMALLSIDDDDTVCKTLEWINSVFKDRYDKIAFCNGGDRTIDAEKPEHKLCLDLGIKPIYGLGDKIQSSSWLTSGSEQAPAQERQSNAGSLFF